MPKVLEKIKDALVKQGKSESSAYAIAIETYNKTKKRKGKKKK